MSRLCIDCVHFRDNQEPKPGYPWSFCAIHPEARGITARALCGGDQHELHPDPFWSRSKRAVVARRQEARGSKP
jgi:hypothetical protein